MSASDNVPKLESRPEVLPNLALKVETDYCYKNECVKVWSQNEDDIVALVHQRMAIELAKIQKELLPDRSMNEIKQRMVTLRISKHTADFTGGSYVSDHDDDQFTNKQNGLKRRSDICQHECIDSPITDRECIDDNNDESVFSSSTNTTAYCNSIILLKRLRLFSDVANNDYHSNIIHLKESILTPTACTTGEMIHDLPFSIKNNTKQQQQLNLSDLKSCQRPPMLDLSNCGLVR